MSRFGFIVGVGACLIVSGAAWPAQAADARVRTVSARTSARASALAQRPAAAELRRSLQQALNRPFPAASADVEQQARDFVALYRQTADSSLGARERGRWRSRLRSRLIGLSKAIARNEASDRPMVTASSSPASSGNAPEALTSLEVHSVAQGGKGGAPRSNAQDLIDLIQSTIAPESWDVNGGEGTIVYWEPGLALVIRATGDVHEQVGGLVRVVGK